MAPSPTPLTFQQRIDALKVDLRSVKTLTSEADVDEVVTELHMVASAASDLAELVGVLADLQGSRPASEAAASLPERGGTMEFKVTAQRPADSRDPRGAMEFEGDNFSDIVQAAERAGYPRVISAVQREVTPWTNVTGYTFAEATP